MGQEDPLEEGMVTHSSIFAWEIPRTEEPAGYSTWGRKESDMTKQPSTYGTACAGGWALERRHLVVKFESVAAT